MKTGRVVLYSRAMAKKLTDKQDKYVKALGTGVSKRQASVLAGYTDTDKGNAAERSLEAAEKVRGALVEEARKYAEISDVSRKACIDAFMDAANMAKLIGEPASMISAWREITKICGHYAPEVKKVEHMLKGDNMKKALELMTDEELLKITHGTVYEGEYTKVEGPTNE